MTGYGRGEQTQEGYKIVTEVSTVNRRQAEVSIYLPRELEQLDARVRTEVNKRSGACPERGSCLPLKTLERLSRQLCFRSQRKKVWRTP